MKKGLLLTFLCVVALSAQTYVTYDTPEVDPTDYVLIAYPLTDAEEAAFSYSDGKVSDFWATWEGRDWIDMTTDQNSYPGRDEWDGPNDAAFKMMAGATTKGLYLYFEITDDIFVDPAGGVDGAGTDGDDWAHDAVDMYIDYRNSEAIINAPEVEMVEPQWGWEMTTTTQQFQVWMGATAMPSDFRFNYYDPFFWSWDYKLYSFTEAETMLNGMGMEAIIVDETHKAQEWFVPWEQIGNGGVADLLDGRRFGFTGGYNDLDGDGKGVNCLRWKNMDPFAGGTLAENGLDFLTTWGDIHMSEGIGVSVVSERDSVSVIDNRRQHSPVVANGATVEFFTLQGQKLSAEAAQRMLKRNTALVRRVKLHDGSFRSGITSRMVK